MVRGQGGVYLTSEYCSQEGLMNPPLLTGSSRPRGSKPKSPGREPSRYCRAGQRAGTGGWGQERWSSRDRGLGSGKVEEQGKRGGPEEKDGEEGSYMLLLLLGADDGGTDDGCRCGARRAARQLIS